MLTRDTIAHTPNSAGSTYHSLVSMPSQFVENVLESFTRQRILCYTYFETCRDKLLVHVWCMFLLFDSCHSNQQNL